MKLCDGDDPRRAGLHAPDAISRVSRLFQVKIPPAYLANAQRTTRFRGCEGSIPNSSNYCTTIAQDNSLHTVVRPTDEARCQMPEAEISITWN